MEQKRSKNSKAVKRPTQTRQSAQIKNEPMSRDELRKMKAAERNRKRRRNRMIGYAVAIVVIIAAAVVLSLTVFFKIQAVSVTGDDIYNGESIVAASGLKVGDNMFLSSKKDIASLIETTLPYIEKAEIKRSPTGKIVIKVKAAKAELALDMGDSYILMSGSAKVLEENVIALDGDIAVVYASSLVSARPGEQVVFENENDTATLININRIINESGIAKISAINITDYSALKLGYDQRITLEVGPVSSFEEKHDFISATLEKLDRDEPNFEGKIDFTIDNKAFINDSDEETTAAPVPTPESSAEVPDQEMPGQAA